METRGQHLLAEYRGCACEVLDDVTTVATLLRASAAAAGATVLTESFHRFRPRGVSGLLLLEESHLSIHCWPEAGYAAVDFYTCGRCDPRLAHEVLMRGLRATSVETMLVTRGLEAGAMRVSHDGAAPRASESWRESRPA